GGQESGIITHALMGEAADRYSQDVALVFEVPEASDGWVPLLSWRPWLPGLPGYATVWVSSTNAMITGGGSKGSAPVISSAYDFAPGELASLVVRIGGSNWRAINARINNSTFSFTHGSNGHFNVASRPVMLGTPDDYAYVEANVAGYAG